MIPMTDELDRLTKAFPRTRGDDPIDARVKALEDNFSPHPRG